MAAGLPLEPALRVVPALASAALVPIVERIGRRVGLELAGWMQAVLLLPFLYAQVLLFDPLLSFCVWLALDAWSAGKDGRAVVAAALAFLAKGPVAALFLVPFGVALAPLRAQSGVASRRGRGWGALLLVVALLPLAGWALAAAHEGGPAFARELLWSRWVGRVEESFAHRRPFWFYGPIVLGGASPVLLLLGARRDRSARAAAGSVVVRVTVAALVALLLLSLTSGKQPHYLLPLAPAAALFAASRLRDAPSAATWLRRGVVLELTLVALATVVALIAGRRLLEPFGERGAALATAPFLRVAAVALALVASSGAAFLVVRRAGVAGTLATLLLVRAMAVLPIHVAAAALLVPQALEARLREEPATPIVLYRLPDPGLYAWFARRSPLDTAPTPEELSAWAAAHRGALMLMEAKRSTDARSIAGSLVARDRMDGRELVLVRTP
jgi:4-amino-4-deoxy-L-arabinose transferase-like glycosyltransferase